MWRTDNLIQSLTAFGVSIAQWLLSLYGLHIFPALP